MQDNFTVGVGETNGEKRVNFYYCQKVTLEDILRMLEGEFPDKKPREIYLLPTAGCTISTGDTFGVKPY